MNKLKILQNKINKCDQCQKHGYPVSINPIFSGKENSRVALVGQAPGIMNEKESYPFNGGQSGKKLFEWLSIVGWDEEYFRSNHYITSITKCYPGKNLKGGDRVPSKFEINLCNEWLSQELDLLKLELIIPMGKLSISNFIGTFDKLTDVIGKVFTLDNGVLVVPIPHPSGASTWYHKKENKILLDNALRELKIIKDRKNL